MAVYIPGRLQVPIDELYTRLEALESMTLQHSSIGRAGLRIYDAGRLVFEGGGGVQIDDDGFIVINGDLSGEGNFSWQGPWDLQGAGKITGDVEIDGKARIKNETTLEDDLVVTSDGRILVGGMTIAQVGSAGRITFPNGAHVHAVGSDVRVTNGNSSVLVSGSRAALTSNGVSIDVSGAGVTINPIGVPTLTGTGLLKGLLVLGDDGILRRVFN